MESTVDWKIHKKLDEARTVYLTVGRCTGKTWRILELCEKLIAVGKRVGFVKPEQFLKGNAMELIPGKRYEWYVNDREDKKENGLFTGEYEKNGNALLVTREGEEWSIPVKSLRKYVKK